MSRPIPNKADIALEYPDKAYIGSFERPSRFDAHLDDTGVSVTLRRSGGTEMRKSIRMHFNHALFAEILGELAKTVRSMPPDDMAHREALRDAAATLCRALDEEPGDAPVRTRKAKQNDRAHRDAYEISNMTPEEEVLLLHVME